jgi:1-acyl-sn-glycerol-3-phosphate acyltransferase
MPRRRAGTHGSGQLRRARSRTARAIPTGAITWEYVSVFYWVVKAILGPILRVVFRPWSDGTDNVPRHGPAIIASNHLSFSDHFFAPLPLPRQVVFLAKSEYFTGSGLKGLVTKAFIGGVGGIPVDRAGGEAGERALRTGLRVLANGQLLGIYPEGTRTPDGRLYRGKTGVARLALEARAPVIPCAMVGTFELQPPGKIVPRLRIRPGVRFGAPLDFSRYYGLESDRIVLRAMTDEIMYAIMKLSGQEYVDEYAKRAKSRLPVAGRGPGAGPDPGRGDAGDGLDPSGDTGDGLDVDLGPEAIPGPGPEADLSPGPADLSTGPAADPGDGRASEPDEVAAPD